MPSKRVDVCVNCSETAIIVARDRCATCTQYARRNGVDRPERLINRPMLCKDCKNASVVTKGRCHACNIYFVENGKKRPSWLRNKHKARCLNPDCLKPLRLCNAPIKGRCGKCHEYKKKRGVNRPVSLTRFELLPGYIYCENPNCDKPLWPGANWTRRNRRCYACYNWLNDNGEERPGGLCPQRVTELGWCDCGNVASHQMEYKFGETGLATGKLHLCGECYQLEMDYQTGVLV